MICNFHADLKRMTLSVPSAQNSEQERFLRGFIPFGFNTSLLGATLKGYVLYYAHERAYLKAT